MSQLVGIRILIVEDEPLISFEMAEALAEYGAIIIGPYADVASALIALGREEPTVAILDWWLLEQCANDVAMALVARQIPFVFYTGIDPRDDTFCKWQNLTVVSKPAALGELVSQIFQVLHRARSRIEQRA